MRESTERFPEINAERFDKMARICKKLGQLSDVNTAFVKGVLVGMDIDRTNKKSEEAS